MVFGFKKHCAICGVDVDKKAAQLRFGKYFCTEAHAEEYVKQTQLERQNAPSEGHGGCC